jgi:hypothetical protein
MVKYYLYSGKPLLYNRLMDIAGKPIRPNHYLCPVTYVPQHAEGNAGHDDCEQGVIIRTTESVVMVLYCKSRTVQATDPKLLVWG